VSPRERLQFLYELAFFPPRLSEFWAKAKAGEIDKACAADWIRGALLLHLALPERGYSSVRALKRLAYYQASSRPFVPVSFLKNAARKLGIDVKLDADTVPPEMVRDIGLPPFCRPRGGAEAPGGEARGGPIDAP
jgi:hypothetical protein